MSMIQSDLLLGQEGGAGYQIERSLRFNSADASFLSRTPASAGNRRTWTWAGWVKVSNISGTQAIFSADGTAYAIINLRTSGRLRIEGFDGATTFCDLSPTPLYRDPSAWYHFVVSVDSTRAISSDRVKLYVNNVEQGLTGTYPSSTSQDWAINSTSTHYIGSYNLARYFSGYLADVHFIDGQALTPTSFGEFDTNNVWQPKAYSGTYGTNGFRLAFADNSNNTATTLGKDSSPNGNNWTPNNLSVTAGAGNDSLVDTPTSYGTDTGAGGEVRGNYCTWNPLNNILNYARPTNGNLATTFDVGAGCSIAGTMYVSAGKWYWEVTLTTAPATGDSPKLGIVQSGYNFTSTAGQSYIDASPLGYAYRPTGQKGNNNVLAGYGASFTQGDIIGFALDLTAGTITAYKNGVSQGVMYSGLSGSFAPCVSSYNTGGTNVYDANFGQRPWAFTPPAGFKALCDTNLPAPTIAKPSTVMDVKLYTGNGTSQTISGLGFSPGLVWIKNRSNGAIFHNLFDTVRGAARRLASNVTDTELLNSPFGYLSAFTGDGFSIQAGSSGITNVGTNGEAYVAWTWDAGASTVTNTQGSITSSCRANPSAGFSICTYTVSASSQTFGHGLNAAPKFCIAKRRNGTSDWYSQFVLPNLNGYMLLNSTNALTSASYSSTSTTFPAAFLGGAGEEWVHYCFAPVAGYSSFGSYTGNGSADGPFVFLGFRPAVVLVKMSSSTGNWTILDDKREGYNVDNDPLFPNLANAEGTTDLIDITSNGFKVRTTDATFNTNAGTYVYAAWASSPFAYARAR